MLAGLLFAVTIAATTPPSRTILATQLENLAAKDNAEATYHLGMMRHLGIGGAKDEAAAVALFRKASEGGDALAAYKLGDYFARADNGVVDADKAEALRLKMIAAEAGYALAQHDVARLHFEAGDVDAALEWLTRAAQQGNAEALRALASLYNSDAVPKDAARTFAYYTLYLQRLTAPTDKQKAFLTDFTAAMTPEDKARGQKIAADWSIVQTSLTKKALAGLRAAEALVAGQQEPTR